MANENYKPKPLIEMFQDKAYGDDLARLLSDIPAVAQDDPFRAVYMIDNLVPEGIIKDAFYAAVAVGFHRQAAKAQSHVAKAQEGTPEVDVYKSLAKYFENQSGYFSKIE